MAPPGDLYRTKSSLDLELSYIPELNVDRGNPLVNDANHIE
jgi:hypothetical protein